MFYIDINISNVNFSFDEFAFLLLIIYRYLLLTVLIHQEITLMGKGELWHKPVIPAHGMETVSEGV